MLAAESGSIVAGSMYAKCARGWDRLARWLAEMPRRQWLALAWCCCGLLPSFFSWPHAPLNAEARAWCDKHWGGIVAEKIANPLYDYRTKYAPESNEAKRNFRVTMPLLARVTGLGLAGLPILDTAVQIVLLLAIVLVAERATASRIQALALALTICGTYVGTAVYRDYCHWFDQAAYAFMALTLLNNPWIAGAGLLLAGFTDERPLVAVPLLVLFHVVVGSWRRVRWGFGAALVLYVLIRWELGRLLGGVVHGDAPNLTGIIRDNLEPLPIGFWSALEGGWILIFAVAWFAFCGRARIDRTAWLVLATVALIGASAIVIDFTRSASYAYPATFVAAAMLSRLVPPAANATRIFALAAAASLLVPNMQVVPFVLVEHPLPVYAAMHGISAVFGH